MTQWRSTILDKSYALGGNLSFDNVALFDQKKVKNLYNFYVQV